MSSIRPIRPEELQDAASYERERKERRRQIQRMRRLLTVRAGDRISLIFETRQTVLYRIQEALQNERPATPEAVNLIIVGMSRLLPQSQELAGVLLIEPVDLDHIEAELEHFQGLDRGGHLFLELSQGQRVPAVFASDPGPDAKVRAARVVRFPMTAEQVSRFVDRSQPVHFVIGHPGYRARVEVAQETRRALILELTAEPGGAPPAGGRRSKWKSGPNPTKS